MPDILYFPFSGPNRYSDRRLVEVRLQFSEADARQQGFDRFLERVTNALREAGAFDADESFDRSAFPARNEDAYARLLAETAMLFQRKTGHRVDFFEVRPGHGPLLRTVLLEHEHCDVGMNAVKLAHELLSGQRSDLRQPFRQFHAFARARLLPLETEAIIDEAHRRGIPCFQMERMPFKPQKDAPGRVRPNGLLFLGHSSRGRFLDGLFAPGESRDALKPLLSDRAKRRAWMTEQGLPTTQDEPDARLHLLKIGALTLGVLETDEPPRRVRDLPPPLADLATRCQQALGGAAIDLVLDGRALDQPDEAAVIDFSLDPDLGRLLAPEGRVNDALRSTAGHLLDWLVPDPQAVRIPLIAVTGTNGKTTTSLMTHHILQQAGRRPGVVCTLGTWVEGKKVADGDAASPIGHSMLLVRQDIDSAVLESHHRGIAVRGFVYRHNDVGICLNVSDDHVAPGGIPTLEEMAAIKRSLVERARKGAVLFADDEHCVAMIPRVTAEQVWLVSLQQDAETLRELAPGRISGCCVLEQVDGAEWIVVHDGAKRKPLLPAADIPAGMGGAARHNIGNAMHAAAAALIIGIAETGVREALRTFHAGPEQTPGRLNVYDRLPFRIVADNAHNAEGLAQMAALVSRLETAGRRILCFAAPSHRTEHVMRKLARAAAGHFDRYFCCDRLPKPGGRPDHHAPLLREELLACGVKPDHVRLATRGEDAWRAVFSACRPGDLLLILLSPVEFEAFGEFVRRYPADGQA